jgi:hypothetical protein
MAKRKATKAAQIEKSWPRAKNALRKSTKATKASPTPPKRKARLFDVPKSDYKSDKKAASKKAAQQKPLPGHTIRGTVGGDGRFFDVPSSDDGIFHTKASYARAKKRESDEWRNPAVKKANTAMDKAKAARDAADKSMAKARKTLAKAKKQSPKTKAKKKK